MAEERSMTVADVVAQVRDGRLEDFLRSAVALVAEQLMEAEVSAEIGAARGQVAPEARVTHRNGYRPRSWETRVGEIDLLVPKKRSGAAYFPSLLEPRRRAEQAIVAVVMEAYVNGVSTRTPHAINRTAAASKRSPVPGEKPGRKFKATIPGAC